ncbi:MAG: hypothetical protein PVI09_18995, partial [Anaerolineae bacterium]
QEVVRLDLTADGLSARGVVALHASLADGDFPQAGELFAVAFRKQDGQWLMAGRQPLARTPTMPPALGD